MAHLQLRPVSLILSGSLTLFAGCGDEEPSATRADANYVVATRIFSDDGGDVTSYLHLVSSLEEGTQVDLKDAIEIPGSAKLFALDDGWLAVGSGDGVTITRYEADPQEGLRETGETIDLQPSGVQSLWDTLYVASSTKVYYADREAGQLVIINPKQMTVEGSVKLPETVREGYLALYSYSAIKRGDKLIFSVGWFDWDNDKVLPETGLVVLDTKTDQVDRFDVDERCGGITTPVTLDSGDTYYVSSALNGAAKFIEREAATPCALRVLAGEDHFDADYALELSDITSGAVAGEPVPAGGDALFLRVLNEDAVTTSEGDASWNVTGQSVWTWWKWEPGDDGRGDATLVDALDPSTADVTFFEVDGRVFGAQTTEDYSETLLLELTAEGGPKPALTVPGFASKLVQL
jgi:hypothetical protein